jgi:hypothetical protein
MWKEAFVAWLKVLSQHITRGTEENVEKSVKIASLRAKIWTRGLPEYEPVVLTTLPRHSIVIIHY